VNVHRVRLAAAGMVTACMLAVASSAGMPSASATSTTTSLASHQPPALHAFGLLPASPDLRDRIVLTTTRAVAGTPISGTLIVNNRGAAAINLTHGCKPQFEVALTKNRHVAPTVAWTADCSSGSSLIAPGINRLHFTLLTTYRQCVQPGGSSLHRIPHCLPGGLPPLPAGRYQAVLVGNGVLALPAPRSVAVTLRS
jgi:hypothetical protein